MKGKLILGYIVAVLMNTPAIALADTYVYDIMPGLSMTCRNEMVAVSFTVTTDVSLKGVFVEALGTGNSTTTHPVYAIQKTPQCGGTKKYTLYLKCKDGMDYMGSVGVIEGEKIRYLPSSLIFSVRCQ